MEQPPQFAAWTHYAEAGESSWHKRWLSITLSNMQLYKSDKPGTKPLFSLSLSSIVTKKLATNFERRHSAVVFTLMRNFILSFASPAELELALSIIIRAQESALGVDLSALVSGGPAAIEISVSGEPSGSSTPQADSSSSSTSFSSLAKLLAKERSNRPKLIAQAAAGAFVFHLTSRHSLTLLQQCPSNAPSTRWLSAFSTKLTCRRDQHPHPLYPFKVQHHCRLLSSLPQIVCTMSCRYRSRDAVRRVPPFAS